MMIDWRPPACGGRGRWGQTGRPPGPARQGRERLTADWRELAAVVPHLVSSAAARPSRPRPPWAASFRRRRARRRRAGEDVAGLAEDLAGLGQGGALAVLAVLDGGVVAVVGSRRAGVGLARLIPAQRSTGGPCRDSRPGGPLRSEDQTVTSSPANRIRLAGRREPAAPPSQQVIASPVTGPARYSRSASTLAPVRCRAAASSRAAARPGGPPARRACPGR